LANRDEPKVPERPLNVGNVARSPEKQGLGKK
jgi:hypothetical protein